MREIKFRAKSALTGSWEYGYFAVDQLGRNVIINKISDLRREYKK